MQGLRNVNMREMSNHRKSEDMMNEGRLREELQDLLESLELSINII
jgi:hypothetical protein